MTADPGWPIIATMPPRFKVQDNSRTAVGPKSPNSISSALPAITHVAAAPLGVRIFPSTAPGTNSSTPLLDPQFDSSVVAPVSRLITHKGDQAYNAPTSRGRIALALSWEAVKTTLVLIKESSDAFPPLKSAVGGLVALIDMIEVRNIVIPVSPR